MHEISPGAIQKSNGLKVTSQYFKSEEDIVKNEIFLRLYIFILYCIYIYAIYSQIFEIRDLKT